MSGAAPRAAGVRKRYDEIPEHVRSWVHDTLGSRVVSTSEQVGGMSPGCATRLVLADGSRAFVKAVGPELNAITPNLFRHEAAVLGHLGDDSLWAPLLATCDEPDGWVALLLGDVEGRHPDLSRQPDINRVVVAVDQLVERLAQRGDGLDIGTLRQSIGRYEAMWPHLVSIPDDVLPPWAREMADHMRTRVPALLEVSDGDHVVNYDIRNDNLLIRPSGEVVFVDWGMSRVGAAWLDPLVLRLEWAELPEFDTCVRTSPSLRLLEEEAVTAFLYLLGTWLAYRIATDRTGPPGINDFRRAESSRFLEGARRRLGVSA